MRHRRLADAHARRQFVHAQFGVRQRVENRRLLVRGEEAAPAHVAPTIEQRLAEAERFSAEVQALHLLRTPEEIFWEAVRRVRGLVQADRVICWRIGDDTTLVLGAADPALPTPPASMPIGELLAGLCAAEAAPVSRGEAELPPPLNPGPPPAVDR